MIPVECRGRVLKRPVATLDVLSDVVRLRVDDIERPEFWLEAETPFASLFTLIEESVQKGDWENACFVSSELKKLARRLIYFFRPEHRNAEGD